MLHAYNSRTQEGEAGGLPFKGQLGLHTKTLEEGGGAQNPSSPKQFQDQFRHTLGLGSQSKSKSLS